MRYCPLIFVVVTDTDAIIHVSSITLFDRFCFLFNSIQFHFLFYFLCFGCRFHTWTVATFWFSIQHSLQHMHAFYLLSCLSMLFCRLNPKKWRKKAPRFGFSALVHTYLYHVLLRCCFFLRNYCWLFVIFLRFPHETADCFRAEIFAHFVRFLLLARFVINAKSVRASLWIIQFQFWSWIATTNYRNFCTFSARRCENEQRSH